MIYLDNAATSFPKPENVYVEMDRCMRTYCSNPGRGSHAMSLRSAMAVTETRERIAKLLNIKDYLNICFTKNTTEALNLAILGCLSKGDHVITTCMEHNSVLRPLKTMEKNGVIKLTILSGDDLGVIDPVQVRRSIEKKTKLIVCTLSSNVNGIIMPVKEIGEIARDRGILFLIDGAQGLGCLKIDLTKQYASMIAFPGHKGLMGPQGTGGLYIAPGVALKPLMTGGTGSKSGILYQPDFLPDKYESGTLNTPGIVGLGAGIEFIEKIGEDAIKTKKDLLIKRLYDGLYQNRYIKLYSSKNAAENSGIIAFNIKDIDSSEICEELDSIYGIACRAGLHCAPLAHNHFRTQKTGIVRMSVGYFNTINEIDRAVIAVNKIAYEKSR
ncbi:aminotransferase class V-fold PLP-dependent enzyme [Ruminiclostridium herbifermentans]|uniref:cysteine desulfurase n=1 Tax=Ruminiclostridium herbifermentans TaxID=2488810 RepID=A0A4U7JIB6_9FIRM|nr:aminotransferase class V-fold PLP-dependent enzyme [Ruminiclostridium herbifermentans]QNU65482.1 aminotransferase class V-fold PLP-dependent enzyme [Ruminiclostridium herbifermentans]